MTLTQKETTLLKDLHSQEQLCVEKYAKYSSEACNGQLKNLFNQIGQTETQHVQTLDQIASGTVPQMSGGSGTQAAQTTQAASYSPADKKKDEFLCHDALSTEKHVSSTYNTCIFEFADTNIRDVL
ncbi:MAG TPA: spore coat protein, partial [Oscillospiraceae bacterium]|nr:spore coat protein [Oscillospiraceae bacterium]